MVALLFFLVAAQAFDPGMHKGAQLFLTELSRMEEPANAIAEQTLDALVRSEVQRYTFWHSSKVPYDLAPTSLTTGVVSEGAVTDVACGLLGILRDTPTLLSPEKFVFRILTNMCGGIL